ncbi:MAG: alpha/beta fold hydrolase [Mycobacteriales bacterium]
MTRHQRLAAAVGAVGAFGLGATALAGAAAAPASAASPAATVHWHQCPQYSDAAIEATGVPPEQVPAFRALWARTECGTVSVPLDYRRPEGRRVDIAITRLKATDRAHRLGNLAVNPGGPGGSGYLVPINLVLRGNAALNERYDLIGFDPRGIGYSTKVNCPPPAEEPPPPAPGPLTEAVAKQLYDSRVKGNQACYRTDPAFLGQLTTANVARDLNQVRQALGERKISYFGASWGTLLGAVYRSMFPATVARMWLDSVVGPEANRLDVRSADVAAATERGVARQAAWIAARDTTYGLGDTPERVEAAILAMRRALDAEPVRFSDVEMPLDGSFIAFLASSPGPLWAEASEALKEMRDARSGTPAPPAVKPIVSPPPDGGPPPADAPERANRTANQAMLCNDDTSPHDFATFWADYQRILQRNPITGGLTQPTQGCAGWPKPKRPWNLHPGGGSLVLSGHRYEHVTPYPWTPLMRSTIGGTVFTVEDDIHGSVPFVPECASHLATYFDTGTPGSTGCQGVQPPDGATPAAATSATANRLRYPRAA